MTQDLTTSSERTEAHRAHSSSTTFLSSTSHIICIICPQWRPAQCQSTAVTLTHRDGPSPHLLHLCSASTCSTHTTAASAPLRHFCAIRNKTFSQAPNMQRHAKKHNRHAQRINCQFPGYPYTGAKGFLRSNKVTSHWQNRHQ